MEYKFDNIDGVLVPPLVVTKDTSLRDIHNGSIHVENGTLSILGIVNGSLDVQSGAKVLVLGQQNGSIVIANDATVIISGLHNGSATVLSRGVLIVEPTGRLAGSLNNQGRVIVRGVFGGSQKGNPVILEGSGSIKEPIIKDGTSYYSW